VLPSKSGELDRTARITTHAPTLADLGRSCPSAASALSYTQFAYAVHAMHAMHAQREHPTQRGMLTLSQRSGLGGRFAVIVSGRLG
jgi:hypothetical protein